MKIPRTCQPKNAFLLYLKKSIIEPPIVIYVFSWHTTPQGFDFWERYSAGKQDVVEEAHKYLQELISELEPPQIPLDELINQML